MHRPQFVPTFESIGTLNLGLSQYLLVLWLFKLIFDCKLGIVMNSLG